MKCTCGYERRTDFGNLNENVGDEDFIRISGTFLQHEDYPVETIEELVFFACPKCGTLKIIL